MKRISSPASNKRTVATFAALALCVALAAVIGAQRVGKAADDGPSIRRASPKGRAASTDAKAPADNPGTAGKTGDVAGVNVISVCEVACPENVTVSNDPSQCGAVVNYPAPTASADCTTVTCSPASGSFFPVGTTTVTCADSGPARVAQPNGVCATETITQSSSQAITDLNSVSCNDGVGHTDNSYYRAFTLTDHGVSGDFDIQSVSIGIETAIAGSGGSQPITVNLYTSSMAFPAGFPGSLTLIGTANATVNDQSLTILTVPVTGMAPAGSQLVVEVFTPDGQMAGNLFFIGSNTAAETGPSYLRAPDCGVTNPTTTGAIGFPDMHIVLNVTGCDVPVLGPTCTFTVTVTDTQPPAITCPANVAAVTAITCPPTATSTVVNYPAPTASDNCPGVTTACVPPSGSPLPLGTTSVTCTATDAAGNTATCSFSVTVFNACIQDDSNPGNVILFNTGTGAYQVCCGGVVLASGVGTVTSQGCDFTLQSNSPTSRVVAKWSSMYFRGSGSLQLPAGATRCTITDRDIRNNTCQCQ